MLHELIDSIGHEPAYVPKGGCTPVLPSSPQVDSPESPCPHEPTLTDCSPEPSALMVVSPEPPTDCTPVLSSSMVVSPEPSTPGSQEPQSTFLGGSDPESPDSPPDAPASNSVVKVADGTQVLDNTATQVAQLSTSVGPNIRKKAHASQEAAIGDPLISQEMNLNDAAVPRAPPTRSLKLPLP